MARMKLITRRQSKDEKKSVAFSNSGRIRDLGSNHTSMMSSSSCTQAQTSQNTPDFYNRNFGREGNQSAMTMYAKMSTAIAKALPEEEFGSQKNPNYRPNARYSSKVIFPVECKRDIFVESVTPAKNRKSRRGSGKHSIYQMNVGREQSPYNEIKNVHMASPSNASIMGGSNTTLGTTQQPIENTIEKIMDTSDIGTQDEPFDEKDDESLTLTYSTDEEKENGVQQNFSRNDEVVRHGKKALFVQTSNTMLDKRNYSNNHELARKMHSELKQRNVPNNQIRETTGNANAVTTKQFSVASGANSNTVGMGSLRIETRTNDDDNFRPSNSTNRNHSRARTYRKSRLHNLHSDHHELNDNFLLKESPPIQRSNVAAMDVSPSSTVSSLTLPAELEYSTPREVFHSMTLPMIIEDDVVLGEI